MIILVILIVVAILFYFGMKFYQFDNSIFSKETGYTFLNTLFDKKIHALKQLYDVIHMNGAKPKLLLDVKIEQPIQTNYADAILINSSGIFVIQLINKKGWISGSEKGYEWIEQMHGDKVEKFPNPIHENMRMIFAMQDLLPDIGNEIFESAVFFSDACSFQQIELNSQRVDVMKYNEMKRWATSLKGNKLTNEQVDLIYNELKGYSMFKN